MTEYITKEQAIEIVEKHQWDWSMALKELESLPDAIGRCFSCDEYWNCLYDISELGFCSNWRSDDLEENHE